MTERMTGSDAVLWHMEDGDTPMHTLKVVVLDPSRRGRPVTIDELALVVGARLGLVSRSTQKVVAAPGFGGRPFWVDDPDFDIRRHLDERVLPAPGDRRELDALCGELGSTFLPRDRALWAMTLVHGLEGGRQAVVVRVHHAIVDGLGALNTLLAVTTDEPWAPSVPPAPPAVATRTSRAALAALAVADTARVARALPRLVRTATGAGRTGKATANPDIPSFFSFRRSSINAGGGPVRTCASGSLDLATLKAIGKATGTTVNGVFHAVVAGALRDELAERGEDLSSPCRAAFGIATDTSAADRLHGNQVTPTFVHLRTDIAEPLQRLQATARSCSAAVAARRAAGLDLTDQFSAQAPRALNASRRWLAAHTTMNPSHVVTANVPGPSRRRWLGGVEVLEWISFAVAVAPASVNLTAHSYDGRLALGVIADPVALPDPAALVARLGAALDELADAVAEPEARLARRAFFGDGGDVRAMVSGRS